MVGTGPGSMAGAQPLDPSRFERFFEPFRFDLVNRVDAKIRQRVLDLGTGAGETALSLARLVGPDGAVTGIDASESMVARATRTAEARGIRQATFRMMEAESLDFPDCGFDIVVSRFGFQAFAHPDAAAKEARRVLKAGGRLGVVVWGAEQASPAVTAFLRPLREATSLPSSADAHDPFRFSQAGRMMDLLSAAGFGEVREERRIHRLWAKDATDYLDVFLQGTPMGREVLHAPPSVRAELARRAAENLRPWMTARGLEVPCEAVLATASR